MKVKASMGGDGGADGDGAGGRQRRQRTIMARKTEGATA
jgi:hypothetical protein